MRTVGVEEEFLLVDAEHDRMNPAATRVLQVAAARGNSSDEPDPEVGSFVYELQEEQLEVYTAPQASMATLEAELRAWRAKAAAAAAESGARVLASATAPVVVRPHRVHTERYDRMAERFGIVTDEQLTCGCHVHVSVASPAEAVAVLDRIRVWLPTLLALSANSPFWQGRDTGYASFRWQALGRWPVSGPTDLFGTAERYRAIIDEMLASETILDEGMLYYDARCSRRYPTVEIRVPDVCADVRDAVLIGALCRALVETAAEAWAAGEPPPAVPTVLLRLATWQAARWGISANLLDPLTSLPRPAAEVIGTLLDHLRPALLRSGDEDLVTEGIERVFVRGNGAALQREVYAKTGDFGDVIDALARATAGETY